MNRRDLVLPALSVGTFGLGAVVIPPALPRLRRLLGVEPGGTQPFWAEMVEYHARMDGSIGTSQVLIFGDSHVQSLNVGAVHPEAVNFGIGGDTVAGLDARLSRYRSVERAAAILIAIGVNDVIHRRERDALQKLPTLLGRLVGSRPILVSEVLPVDLSVARCRDMLGQDGNMRIDWFNHGLREACARAGARIAVRPVAFGTTLPAALHGGDGLHLSTAGYALWIEHLRTELDRARRPA